MTAKHPRRPRDEDEAQSRRFIDLAHDLERKGELDPEDDGSALDRLVQNAPLERQKGD
jgi:hypothetical protein